MLIFNDFSRQKYSRSKHFPFHISEGKKNHDVDIISANFHAPETKLQQ